MESTKEAVMKKENESKSPMRYAKRMPTYVVALAVQETLDDPQKLQLTTNKRSSENSTLSIKSISPTDSLNSTKTFTISPTEKLSSVLDIATLNEVKTDIVDENQCGDVVEKKSPQISSDIVIDNMTAEEQPEVIFNAPKHTKKCKDTKRFPRKKPRKSKRVIITFKNIHFKYKKPKNGIIRRLEKYYEKTKSNTPNAEQIQKQIYSNVLSTVVSRSQVLKKVLAKENLIADSEILLNNDVSIVDYDENSLNSSPSTTKKSFTSYTSQNTLVRKDSSSSSNEDYNNIKTADSFIHETTYNPIPYKSEIINVALAVAFDESKTNNDQTAKNSNDTLIHKENLTSSETFLQNNTTELTSKPSSSEEPKNYIIDYDDLCPVNLNPKVQSNATITQEVKSLAGVYSDDNTFVIAQTSSDFNKSSINSDCTLTFNSETKLNIENVSTSLSTNDEFSNDNSEKKTTLVVDQSSFFKIIVWLKKLKNLGYYPKQTPSIGSGANCGNKMNDVLVTDNIINSLPLTSKNINDDTPTDTKKTSVLRKPIEVKINDVNYLKNNISLPNDLTIKADLKEVQEDKRSNNDRNTYPTDLADMWERLTLVLDLAVKRLEETLADRIVKDIRASLTISNQPEYKEPTIEIHRTETSAAPVRCERPIPIMLHKGIFVLEEHLKRDVDMCVQCDLVQKQVIDQLMLKLSVEAPKPIPSSVEALKVLQSPEIMKDYVEILKPRVAQAIDSASVEVSKVNTVTVSTATTELSTVNGFSQFKLLFTAPLAFLRANMVVLTSVPTFFIVLFCLYGVIVIIMKPW